VFGQGAARGGAEGYNARDVLIGGAQNNGLPFKVVTHAQMVSHIRDYQHIIIDTEGNPTDDDFKDLARNCDLLVIPAVPESVATDGLTHTPAKLRSLGNKTHRVLLTPPKPRTDGQQLRDMLTGERIPVFTGEIPRLAAFEKAAPEGVPVYGVKDDRNAAVRGMPTKRSGRKSLPFSACGSLRAAVRMPRQLPGFLPRPVDGAARPAQRVSAFQP
jgi:hypothetical protein